LRHSGLFYVEFQAMFGVYRQGDLRE